MHREDGEGKTIKTNKKSLDTFLYSNIKILPIGLPTPGLMKKELKQRH
jgi:hypothetical protein